MTILVVDDEADLRFMTKLFLDKHGVESVEAPDGSVALELCEGSAGRFQLVITDENMPRLSGSGLRDRLADLFPDLPVHVWSCLPDPSRGIALKQPTKVVDLVRDTVQEAS